MEALRFTAMLLVLLYHVAYWDMAVEDGSIHYASLNSIAGYALLKSVSMPCVNLFVMISGWYGIRLTFSKLARLAFQVLFFSIPIYLLFVCYDEQTFFSLNTCLHLCLLEGYWFIPAYLLLCLLSPILNAYVENTPLKVQRDVLCALYAFMFLYSWIQKDTWFNHGCSPLFFVLLYLLASYLRHDAAMTQKLHTRTLLIVYLTTICFVVVANVLFVKPGHLQICSKIYDYNSPFNILCAVSLLLLFARMKFHSRIVNWLGGSCFAIYLLHAQPVFYERVFYPQLSDWFSSFSGFPLLVRTFGFLIVLIVGSLLIDQFRKYIWNLLSSIFHHSNRR